ncbi:MAG TPA: hypothetical protein VF069_12945 [Streptosporangiaceae bacterium]
MMSYQLRFDGGRQQRYLPDRAAVLRAVLSIGPRAADPRFEVWAEGEPLLLADGSPGGRRFELTGVLDVSSPGEYDRIRAELDAERPEPADE